MKKRITIIIIVIVAIAAAIWILSGSKSENQEKYTFAVIEKSDLEALVSSTGTLSAVTTVQVGTQVSGRIAKLFVDFNSKVKKGELLAQLDILVLTQALYDAETSLDKARLQFQQSELDLKRIKILFDQQLKTQNDLDQAQYNFNVAKTNLKSVNSNLERAKINLSYASIYSPIDGTVIARNIDVGQTVAASFSSPTLFLIANDLGKMQIQANVDESDIGQIKEKQMARFTVQAYPNRTFEGEVSQIRLQPQTIQNVVSYTAVINVDNSSGLLLPGMTATVDFIIGQAKGILKVPNAALRIRPNAEMIALLSKEFGGQSKNSPQNNGAGVNQGQPAAATGAQGRAAQAGSGGNPMMRMFGSGNGAGSGMKRSRDFAILWFLDDKGNLQMTMVRTGLSDGQFMEVRSEKIREGMKIIKSLNDEASGPNAPRPPMMRMF